MNSIGKVSEITCRFLFTYLFFLLIDIFFNVDSKSTICFRRSHAAFEILIFKIIKKNLDL